MARPTSPSSRIHRLTFSVLAAATCVFAPHALSVPDLAPPPPVLAAPIAATHTIAVVRSDDSWYTVELRELMVRSLVEMSSGRSRIIFLEEPVFDGRAGDEALRTALLSALADPRVDTVLVSGFRASALAGDPSLPLSKPVLGVAFVDPELTLLPVDKGGRPVKANYAVVSLAPRTASLLAQLREDFPFSAIQLLVDPRLASSAAELEAWRARCAVELGCPVRLIPLDEDVARVLASLDPAQGPVCLLPSPGLSAHAHAALLAGLRERRIPVYSIAGQSEVEQGALAGLLAESRPQLARRMAVVFDQVSAGVSTSLLVLQTPPQTELFLNEDTVSRVGLSLRLDTGNRATLVGPGAPSRGKALSLSEALATSLQRNPQLRARVAGTEASRQDVRAATGSLLPQVAAVASYQQMDRDRATASGGIFQERTGIAGFALSQTLFDDEANSRLQQARVALKAASAVERVQRLDTAAAAAQAYLQLLSARAALRVTEQNLRTTRKHLELANLRQRVGTSGPEDIYRFEALAAQQRSEFTSARMQVERARTALNRALGVDATLQWEPRDLGLGDEAFAGFTLPLTRLIGDRATFEQLRAWCVAYAAAHSPDIEAYGHGVEAQRLLAEQKGRRGFVPKLSATANIGHQFERHYGGPTLTEQLNAVGLPVPHSALDRTVWNVGVQASVPLFAGGSLDADTRKARAQLRQLQAGRDATADAVIAQTQASLYSLLASFNNIELSATSARLAERNLAVIQQKYEQGAVSIVTLLDAQNTAFAQRQGSEVAIYRFFSDVIQLQRLFGWMEPLSTAEENSTLLRDIEASLRR